MQIRASLLLSWLLLVGISVFHAPLASANANMCSRVYQTPLAQNTSFELLKVTNPDGIGKGDLFHFEVRDEMVRKILAAEGSNFKAQRVDIFNENPTLYKFLGFNTSRHPILGEFWSAFPSPALFNHRVQAWNRKHHDQPEKQIHVRLETTGADAQIKMLHLWLNHSTIGVADPFKGFEEFYIPNGSAPPSPETVNRVEILETRGGPRVREHNTLHRHDMDQVANSIFLNKEYLAKTRQIQTFWLKALDIVRHDGRLIDKPLVREYMKAFEGFTSRHGEKPMEGRDGMTPTEVLKIYLHHGQRGLHSITHILSWLIKAPAGIEPGKFWETARGLSFEIEAGIHFAGLGRKAPGSKAPGSAPNLLLNWARAKETGDPVTLKSALDYTTNAEIARIKEFIDLINNPRLNALFEQMQNSGELASVKNETLIEWEKEIRKRYTIGLKE